jgi:hypothetical protein
MNALKFFSIVLFLTIGLHARAENLAVDFAEPIDGEVVSSPFKVKFLVTGMRVAPAGDMSENTGHHHLIINGNTIASGQVVPADEQHIHFGKGQTETTLNLPSGDYQLTLQFANGLHQSYGERMSKTISVTVK